MAFWKMFVLLALCASLAATIATDTPSNSGRVQCPQDDDPQDGRECQLVEEKQCANHFSGPRCGMFPHRELSMSQAVSEFGGFSPLLELNNYCSHVLHSFLCFHYFPPCVNRGQPAFVPCRELCEVAWNECLNYTFQHLAIPPPQHLMCQNFPSNNSNHSTVCPSPADHFDFSRPLDLEKKGYTVLENDTTLEVCVKLVSTYSSNNTLTSPATIFLTSVDKSAKAGDDYKPESTALESPAKIKNETGLSTLEFPAESTKGTEQCINVSIVDDLLLEGKEVFSIHATVNSSSGARFGGALNSSSGAIEVSILDNDECIIPQPRCGGECGQRPTASRSAFTNNDYTYAAHVKLLGRNVFEECTAINVYIISCWNLKTARVCEKDGSTITIPTCVNCPTFQVQEGEEYLIAGVHRRIKGVRRMILPSSRQEGLFTEWNAEQHGDLFDK